MLMDSTDKSELSFLLDPEGPMAAIINASHNGIMVLDRQGIIVCYYEDALQIYRDAW